MSNNPIAFFDSGIGGLTVLAQAIKQLPQESLLYYADDLNQPYGTKSAEQVKSFTDRAVQDIIRQSPDIKALVIACNTATSAAVNFLRKKYSFPVIGMEPAIKPALNLRKDKRKRVLVAATNLTLAQPKFSELVAQVNSLDSRHLINPLAMPELVEYAEKLVFDKSELFNYFDKKFSKIELDNYCVLVLGCTHFSFFKNLLQEYLPPHLKIVDGSLGTIKRLKDLLPKKNATRIINKNGSLVILCSGASEQYLKKMKTVISIIMD